MKIKLSNKILIIPVIAFILNGCLVSKIMENDKKLESNYQRISKVVAYKNTFNSLYLCIDFIVKGKKEPQTVSLLKPWEDFELMRHYNIGASGDGRSILYKNATVPGCEKKSGFTPVDIEHVVIPAIDNQSIKSILVINNLPRSEDDFTLYLISHEKFKLTEQQCKGFFGAKDCYYHLSDSWPTLVIKTKTKNKRPDLVIVGGHTGLTEEQSQAKKTGAALVDVVTFPLQALTLVFWSLFGSN